MDNIVLPNLTPLLHLVANVWFQNNELQTHLQGMSSVLTEKNREIAELRKDRDRHLSQNRLAALKAATIGYVDADTTSSDVGKVGKKKRHSY